MKKWMLSLLAVAAVSAIILSQSQAQPTKQAAYDPIYTGGPTPAGIAARP